MKLTQTQIEEIKAYIDNKNIWYQDIKDELLDHTICGVEAEMDQNDMAFKDAVAKVALEIKPQTLQRAKLKTEHIRTFKELFSVLKDIVMVKPYQMVLCVLFAISLTTWTGLASEVISTFHVIVLLLLFFNFSIRTIQNKAFAPLHNSLFMSRMNAIYLSAILAIQTINFFLSDWIETHPWALITYMSLFNCYMLAGFQVLNKCFLDLKNHGATQ